MVVGSFVWPGYFFKLMDRLARVFFLLNDTLLPEKI